MPARYYPNARIDRSRWDAVIAADPHRLPYGFSWWLDIVTDNKWDAIIVDDYRVVFPLPFIKRFGPLRLVQRAIFTQQGGPYGQVEAGDLAAILSVVPRLLFFLDYPLMHGILPAALPANYQYYERVNLLFSLDEDYPALRQRLHKVQRRRLRKYPAPQLQATDRDQVLQTYRQFSGIRAGLQEIHYQKMHRLIDACIARDMALLYRLDDENGLLAAGFFPVYKGRIINLFAGSTEAGYAHSGMLRLLAGIFARHQGAGMLFDFEGSDLPGVQYFFRQFGPVDAPYLAIRKKGWWP